MACGSPWNTSMPIQDISFHDVMSEDLARDLHERENSDYLPSLVQDDKSHNLFDDTDTIEDTSNDFMVAQLLQYEFDKEHDRLLKIEEKHINKNCKVSISLDKYKLCPSWYGADSDDDYLETELDESSREIDSFESRKKKDPFIPSRGYTKQGDRLVTKHDAKISGRKNAEKIMSLPPGINTGDGGGFDMELTNKVYNKLHHAAMTEARRKQRVHDKVEKATSNMALDPRTRLIIFKMVNNSILESMNGIIGVGKESVVFHAQGGILVNNPLPAECAIKVFKTTLTDFKTRERYIREDYRFKDRLSKNNSLTKEYHNLRSLQKAGVSSPVPLLIKKHVLVMSFIGSEGRAATKIKDIKLSRSDWNRAFIQVKDAMSTMFSSCKLVHADMSEFNILWHDNKCWIIDLGQAIEPNHPRALEFLHRDCTNIINFFSKKGLQDLPTPFEFFQQITGISLPQSVDTPIRQIEDYEVSQKIKKKTSHSDDVFEQLWNEIKFQPASLDENLVQSDEDETIEPNAECTNNEERATQEETDEDVSSWTVVKGSRKKKNCKMDNLDDMSKLNIISADIHVKNSSYEDNLQGNELHGENNCIK